MKLVRNIENVEDLKLAVEETRNVLLNNDISLVEDCTLEKVLCGTKEMQEIDEDWTVEDELSDLIIESWGEDC